MAYTDLIEPPFVKDTGMPGTTPSRNLYNKNSLIKPALVTAQLTDLPPALLPPVGHGWAHTSHQTPLFSAGKAEP